MDTLSPYVAGIEHLVLWGWARLESAILSPSGSLSIFWMASTALIAAWWVSRGRLNRRSYSRRPGRPFPSMRVLRRALFPRHWLFGPSARADLGFVAMNLFINGALFGWAILSGTAIAHGIRDGLVESFGPVTAPLLTGGWASAAVTLLLYLAYELAYFTDHSASHKIPFLWHFHRTHHLAETLSPLTNHRVHPVDSIVFYNIVALFTGAVGGLCAFALPATEGWSLWGGNVVLLAAMYVLTPLQHSHIWIPTTGLAGRIIMSPAHHQLHHSDDPAHHDCNFGNTLAIFDWLAGTLCAPSKQRQRLVFGAGDYPVNPHSVTGGLLQPFVEAIQSLIPGRNRSAPLPAGALNRSA